MPLDEAAQRIDLVIPGLEQWAGRAGALLMSPAQRCRLPGARVAPELRPWDLGRWTGRPLFDLPPDELAAWRTDPDWAGHGGESLRALHNRVVDALHALPAGSGRTVAVTHGAVVQAAVGAALGAPLEAFWSVDVSPATCTELHRIGNGSRARWRLCRLGDRSAKP